MAKTTDKIDLFKEHKDEYKATAKPTFVEVESAQYLMIDGQGAPGGTAFEDRIGALYGMAFTIKMTRKAAGLGDYTVCKLETLWWIEDGSDNFCEVPQDQWCWTMLIRTPDCVKQIDLDKAVEALLSKGKAESVKDVRLESMDEGKCVQMLHVGSYEEIGASAEKMKRFAEKNNMSFTGRHHDIYLSDPRRVAPEKLKTIIRRPVK